VRERAKAMKYPDDADGDALRRMEAEGDDLSLARGIEFTVVFPSESTAKRFANHFEGLGYTASTEFTQSVQDLAWDVIIVKRMIPSYEAIVAFEDSLRAIAGPLGGRNDGWGCLSEGPSSEQT